MKKSDKQIMSIKLKKNGTDGAEVIYSYLYGIGGATFIRKITHLDDCPVHEDVNKLTHRMNRIVAAIEGYDYARKLLKIPGYEATDNQMKLIEGTVQAMVDKVQVSGVSFSKKKKSEGVIISYLKYDESELSTGHATAWIDMEDSVYGIEEDLLDITTELKNEALKYIAGEKYASFEQLTIDMPDNEIEDAEVVD